MPKITLSTITLIVALLLSAVASWYSIVGLAAIFAGAAIPVIIMGIIFDISKVNTTAWLKKYWHRCGLFFKVTLVSAVLVLSTLTSLGIFGFLSSAHLEVGNETTEQLAKIAEIDERISTQKDIIASNKETIKQLDSQLATLMANTASEGGAIRGIQLRRQQNNERSIIQKDIDAANKEIAKLSAERAPLTTQLRKFEAEVGPIKYIASMIYGDNPSQESLDRAVRWMIILLVIVFDPLALLLVLAANSSKKWDEEDAVVTVPSAPASIIRNPSITTPEPVTPPLELVPYVDNDIAPVETGTIEHEPTLQTETPNITEVRETPVDNSPVHPVELVKIDELSDTDLIPTDDSTPEYININGKRIHRRVAESMYPELLVDSDIVSTYGSSFPKKAKKDELFVRTDIIPHKLFRFGTRIWVEANKETTPQYLQNHDYLKYLISLIEAEKYSATLLTSAESEAIKNYLG